MTQLATINKEAPYTLFYVSSELDLDIDIDIAWPQRHTLL
jgi:hypothetical protein